MTEQEYWQWFREYIARCCTTDKFGHLHPWEPRKKATEVFGLRGVIAVAAWQHKNQAKINREINRAAKPFGMRLSKTNVGYAKLERIPSPR